MSYLDPHPLFLPPDAEPISDARKTLHWRKDAIHGSQRLRDAILAAARKELAA